MEYVALAMIFLFYLGVLALVLYARQRNFYIKESAPSPSHNNVSPKFPACKEVIDHVETVYSPLTVREQWCISRAWDFIGGKLRA